MYADSTPCVSHAPSRTRPGWPPHPAQRERIELHDQPLVREGDEVSDPPRHRKPVTVRTYITAGGVVVERLAPKRRDMSPAPAPLIERPAPRPLGPWREEIDEVPA